jgi:hypothetical protein
MLLHLRYARKSTVISRPSITALRKLYSITSSAVASGHASAVPPSAATNFRLAMLIATGPSSALDN